MSTIKYFNAIDKGCQDVISGLGIKETDDSPAVVVCRSAKLFTIEDGKKVPVKELARAQIVGRAGVGTGNVPVAILQDKLVNVVYAPGGNACGVAEHTLGKLIDAAKNTMDSVKFVKGKPEVTPQQFEKLKSQFKGWEIHGKSIIVFGLGNIASRFICMCGSLKMRVIVIVRPPVEGKTLEDKIKCRLHTNTGCASKYLLENLEFDQKPVQVVERIVALPKPGVVYMTTDVEGAIPLVDFHSVHIGVQSTGPVINADYLGKAKEGCVVLNTDRGALIDEEAMLKGLQDGKVSQYHTDFAPALAGLRAHVKCYASPHTAASTGAAEKRCATMVTDAVGQYMFDGNVINSKNFPEVFMDRVGLTRVAIVSKVDLFEKAAGILSKFTVLQSKAGNNGKVFVALFDLKEQVSSIPELTVLEGKARVLPPYALFEEYKKKADAEDDSVYNFFAGPACLPKYVTDGLRCWMRDWHRTGIPMASYSHRSPYMTNMMKELFADMTELLKIPKNYKLLFVQGGATFQFTMLPLNISKAGDRIGFVRTGTWSTKAIDDAKKCVALGAGNPDFIVDGSALKWKELPEVGPVPQDLAYLHLAWNETIHGLEWPELPETGKVPLVLDASSNIFSRPIPWETKNIGCVFGGAQKNSGIAGSAFVIIREDLMEIGKAKNLPVYLNLSCFAEKDSMWNTPSTLTLASIYFNCKWLKMMGGVDAIEKLNLFKAGLIYDTLENSGGYYIPRAKKEHRSVMNIVFNLKGGKDLEKKFVAEATQAGMFGLGGHRSIGGARASVYNGMPVKGCKKLANFCVEFQKNNPL